MPLYFILFSSFFVTSIGFKFDPITANATVGVPFTLTWHLDQADDPDKVYLEQRLSSQNSGEGTKLHFSFPNNGTRDGTVPVTFSVPGEHLVEAFEDNPGSPIASSNKFNVSSPISGSDSGTTSASTSTTASVAITTTNTSPAVPISSTSPSYSNGDLLSSSSFAAGGSGSSPEDNSATTTQTTTPTMTPVNTAVTTSLRIPTAVSSATYGSSVSPSSTSKNSMVSSAIGSPSKTPLIVGATVGSFVFLVLLLVALVYTLRRRQWQRKQYPAIFHRDRMVRMRSNASFAPLTPTEKDPDTYTNSADVEKHASHRSTDKDSLTPSNKGPKGRLEYSLPAPLAPRAETPSPIPAHTDRQMEIYDVLVKKNTDLIRLKTELRRGGDVQEEIEGLKATIGSLEEALASPWALGHTDEMPYEVSRALVPT